MLITYARSCRRSARGKPLSPLSPKLSLPSSSCHVHHSMLCGAWHRQQRRSYFLPHCHNASAAAAAALLTRGTFGGARDAAPKVGDRNTSAISTRGGEQTPRGLAARVRFRAVGCTNWFAVQLVFNWEVDGILEMQPEIGGRRFATSA